MGAGVRGSHLNGELFWTKVESGTPRRPSTGIFGEDCWEWIGLLDEHGYGKYSARVASRVAWELTFGPIPEGLFVLHRCDNPPCCRPDHLFLGTNADNMADAAAKGRKRNTWSKGPRVLDPAIVRAVFERAGEPGADVARALGISPAAVSRYRHGSRRNDLAPTP
jgi:hypothetical protein